VGVRGISGRLALIGLGAVTAGAVAPVISASRFAKDLERNNFRGRTVTLAGGPALAASASVTSALGARDGRTAAAALTAGLASGAVGLYDDIVGTRPEQKAYKGFKGHLNALKQGKVSSGLVKIAGVGSAAVVASAMLPSQNKGLSRAVDVAVGAGVIAGMANLLNLLDLRPGRALKAGTLIGAPLSFGAKGGTAAGPTGAAVSLLPQDLGEEIMLGDAGANALGALLGVSIAARRGTWIKAGVLAAIAGLTLASEKVSFTTVIERTPVLREIDAWGRRD
jgi:UDP-N-acetylmuramyl pentapeptide phosphotransferase/UDP-N-acetylglucosamine-1-phosphate transferase